MFIVPLLLTALALYLHPYFQANELLNKLCWVLWTIPILYWLYSGVEYLSSDFVVTNHRLMMREGFFTRHTNETQLTSVSQVNVNQSLVGQIFNYGNVVVNAFGATDEFFMIGSPFRFQQAINEQVQLQRSGGKAE